MTEIVILGREAPKDPVKSWWREGREDYNEVQMQMDFARRTALVE